MEQLRGAARGAGADACTVRQCSNGARANQHIADILARQHGGNGDFSGADSLDILGRMHGKVDLARQQRGIEFLGPQRLAADLGQRPVLHAVAAGEHRDQFDIALIQPMRRDQPRARFFGLGQGEGRTAGAEAQDGLGHGRLC